MKFLGTILILFFFEFAMGQIPGTPSLLDRRPLPSVHTLSYTSPDLATAVVNCHVINSGVSPVTEYGILWGTSEPTITNNLGKTTITTNIGTGGPFTSTATSLPYLNAETIYIVAYAKTSDGKTQNGNILTLERTVQSPYTGKRWMTFNLGATKLPTVPKVSGDLESYGHLYQWGRRSDGHQIILPLKSPTYASGVPTGGTPFSDTVRTQFDSVQVTLTNNKFVVTNSQNWIKKDNGTLWQGINGTNNPCPVGFRVPTVSEFEDEINRFSPTQTTAAASLFSSFLRLGVTGIRNDATNSLIVNSTTANYFKWDIGRYWTSTQTSTVGANTISINSSGTVGATLQNKSRGHAVRCIQGDGSSGGTAVVSSYISTGSTGTMLAGEQVLSTVTQTLSANVSSIGTYNIAAVANGVTFRGTGTFTTTGPNKPIVLTASGTPELATAPGSPISYVTNTIPSGTFTRTVAGLSTNGSSEVSSYTAGSSTGTMYFSVPVSGVTQTITANVTALGSYNFSAIKNGVTFNARGNFTNTGSQDIVLTASGTPTQTGINEYILNTTPSTTFTRTISSLSSNGQSVVASYTTANGAGTFAFVGTLTASVPVPQNNTVYQRINANVTTAGNYNLSTNTVNGVTFAANGTFETAGNPKMITLYASGTPISTGTYSYTLNTTPNVTFTVTTVANPSSNGSAKISTFSLGEFTGTLYPGITASGVTQKINVNVGTIGTYNISTTSSPANGVTFAASGSFTSTGLQTIVLTASGTGTYAGTYNYSLNTTPNISFNYIANEISTNGTARVSSYSSKGSGGEMTIGDPVNGVYENITANVSTIGTYNITTNTVNGVTFSSGGNQNLNYTGPSDFSLSASGTPISTGTFSYTLNTTPTLTFSRTTLGKQPSTNGSAIAIFEFYEGIYTQMKAGVDATGITQVIRYYASKSGTYDVSATANGVTFSSKGNLLTGGVRYITLTASGTPTQTGNFNFTLNTNQGFTLNHTVYQPSTVGTAVMSYNSTGSSTGTLKFNQTVTPNTVKQNINVNVTTLGTYNISAVNSGITFTASGTFTTLGNQNIVFNASGTPSASGRITYNTNTSPIISFTRTVDP
jgi:uncharacterized protein (TIGR02145 family)